jgi:hypothetical protein
MMKDLVHDRAKDAHIFVLVAGDMPAFPTDNVADRAKLHAFGNAKPGRTFENSSTGRQ